MEPDPASPADEPIGDSPTILEGTAAPGLEDLLGHPDTLEMLDEFIATPGIAGSELARELSQVEFDGGGLLSARLSQVAEQIGDLFMGRRRELVATETRHLDMAALVVQCPEGAATSAVLHLVATTEQRATCAVRFKPFGGGPSHEVAFTVADTYEQRGPGATLVWYSFPSTWEQWEVETRTGEVLRYPKLAEIDYRNPAPKTDDGPPAPPAEWGPTSKSIPLEFRGAARPRRSLEIANGLTFDVSVDLSVFGMGLTVEAMSRRLWATKIEHTYDPRSSYLAEYYPGPGAWWVRRL